MIDKEQMVGVLDDFPNQIQKGFFELAEKVKVKGDFKNIVFAGMGGSALPGDIAQTLLRDISRIPIFVHKSYDLPRFVGKDTLLFVVSYSGNTEETLSAYKAARGKSCTTIIVTSGGKLRKIAEHDKKPVIVIPSGIQPRLSIGYMFFSILKVLQNAGIVKDSTSSVKQVVEKLKDPKFKMNGEELSSKLVEKVPIIYSSDTMKVVAEIWKIAFNENCKISAFYNYFPELNHNEMLGFTTPRANFHVIMIREDDCHRRVAKRFKVTKNIISKNVSTIEIVIKGHSQLLKVFSAIYLGYWTSYFLALKYGVDPTPVELVEQLKKKL